MENLTDNEIIKALEYCTGYPSCPTDCPLYEQPVDCLLKLSKPTLDLINRQKAENEELQTENKQLQSDVLIANQNYEHIKEIWEADKTRLSEKIKEYIDKHNELITKEAAIRAEAVKEVFDRLKEAGAYNNAGLILFVEKDLDSIFKEAEGEVNAG